MLDCALGTRNGKKTNENKQTKNPKQSTIAPILQQGRALAHAALHKFFMLTGRADLQTVSDWY